jgi:hypothetical protein
VSAVSQKNDLVKVFSFGLDISLQKYGVFAGFQG